MALVALAAVVTIAVGVLQIIGGTTRRQASAVDDKRAFYLAEAGLAEAYFSLRTGGSGQIGSNTEPAWIADGLAWVDATERGDGLVELRSTGLCDAGRATVEIVVERAEQPLGIFAEQSLDLTGGFLADGFDSTEAPYEDALKPGRITVARLGDDEEDDEEDDDERAKTRYHVDETNQLLFYDGIFYRYTSRSDRTFDYDASFDFRAHLDMGFDWNDFFDGDDWSGAEYDIVVDHFATLAAAEGEVVDTGSLGPSSGEGGLLGSNGDIRIGGETIIFGDLATGPTGSVSLGADVQLSGGTSGRPEELVLPGVVVPTVAWLPGFTHDSAIPRVLVPGVVGYDSITVAAGSELVIPAFSDVVVQDLTLQSGALLTIQNEVGPANVYITGTADLASGARVEVEGRTPSDLSMQVAGVGPVNLGALSHFYGMVYAPDAEVAIGADFELFGFVAAENLSIAPGARLHFDESVLEGAGSVPMPRLVAWTIEEVPTEVRQSRIDPFLLLDVDKDDLDSMNDAAECTSWKIVVDHYVGFTKLSTYEGPIEYWAPPADSTSSVFKSMAPPDEPVAGAAGTGTWWLTGHYESLFSYQVHLDQSVESWAADLNPLTPAVIRMFDWEVTLLP